MFLNSWLHVIRRHLNVTCSLYGEDRHKPRPQNLRANKSFGDDPSEVLVLLTWKSKKSRCDRHVNDVTRSYSLPFLEIILIFI
ncbi:unnamed protein product [Rhizophagus irregularis]|nr:unnamed protein product [Rhizophagus irregularis]